MSTESRSAGVRHNGVLDVSGLETARVQQYAREVGDAYIERKGGRTYLVTE